MVRLNAVQKVFYPAITIIALLSTRISDLLLTPGTRAGRSLDMDNTPWRPKAAPLMTRWASAVDPARPHPEYPRPQLVRAQWQSLNGVWDLEMEG